MSCAGVVGALQLELWNNISWTEMARVPNTWFMAEMEKLRSAINDTLTAYKDMWVLFQKKIRLLPFPPQAINDSNVKVACALCYEDVLTYQRSRRIIGSLPSTPTPYLCLKSQDMLPAPTTFPSSTGDLSNAASRQKRDKEVSIVI